MSIFHILDTSAASCSMHSLRPATVVWSMLRLTIIAGLDRLRSTAKPSGAANRPPRVLQTKTNIQSSVRPRETSPSRKHRRSIVDTDHHTISLQRSGILHFYTVLTTIESPSTTRMRLLFFRYPPCLAALSHMQCLASSLLRRFHKRVTVSAALGCDSKANLASHILPDNVSVLDLELRLGGS